MELDFDEAPPKTRAWVETSSTAADRVMVLPPPLFKLDIPPNGEVITSWENDESILFNNEYSL